MKAEERWQPTKFVHRRGKWVASSDGVEVGPGSRFIADLACGAYERALGGHAGGDLLDLGCGKVPLYGAYRNLVSSVTCIDWPQSTHPSIHVDVQCDLRGPIPFPDASFDTVLATDLLEHLPNVENCWSEMVRLLRPSGRLIVGVPFLYWLHEVPNDYCRYTEYALAWHCAETKLEVMLLEAYGGSPEVIVDIVLKHLALFPSAARLGYLLARATVQLPTIRRLSLRTRKMFPLGYVLIARKNDVGTLVAAD